MADVRTAVAIDAVLGQLIPHPTAVLNPSTKQEEAMQLLTAELRARLPALYEQEKNDNQTVFCKFFCPWSDWTWFATEGGPCGGDFIFFGYVIGFDEEWGYFTLSGLESVRGPGGLTIERDLYFRGGPFIEVLARHRRERG
jgi:hypothetical protein